MDLKQSQEFMNSYPDCQRAADYSYITVKSLILVFLTGKEGMRINIGCWEIPSTTVQISIQEDIITEYELGRLFKNGIKLKETDRPVHKRTQFTYVYIYIT